MKKLSILLFSILAFTLVSCEDDFKEPTPQSNPQEALMSYEGLEVARGADISQALDLNTTADELNVISTVKTPVLSGNQKIEYIAYVSTNENFDIQEAIEAPDGTVSKNDLDAAFRKLHGKSPKAKSLHMRFAAFLADGTSRVRFGTDEVYFAATEVSVTPIPVEIIIEEEYYLIGNFCDWDISKALVFKHSGKDVYDDPVFNVAVEVGKDCYWKILPKSSVVANTMDGAYGVAVDGDISLTGDLVNVGAQAGKIENAGWVRFSINMMDLKYTIATVTPSIYLVGQPNGWDINGRSCPLVSENYDGVYVGTFELKWGSENNFRFYTELGDWDKNSIGSQVDDNPVDVTDLFVNGIYSGNVVEGKGSFKVSKNGVYKITVDIIQKTIVIELAGEAKALYMVGDINGWSLDPAASGAKAGAISEISDKVYQGTLELPDSGDSYSYFRFYEELVPNQPDNTTIGTLSGGVEELGLESDGSTMFEVAPGKQGKFKIVPGKYEIEVNLDENIVLMQKL